MAQTKRKRRRKHRGTQGGRVDSSRRPTKPRSRAEAKAQARSRRRPAPRTDAPPTWRFAVLRGLAAAAVFAVMIVLIFGKSIGYAIGIASFMLVFYVPAGYYMDTMLWRRRERARIRAAEKQ